MVAILLVIPPERWWVWWVDCWMPLPFRDGCQGTHPADSAKDLSGMLSNINLEEMCKNAPERAVGQMQVPFSDGNVQYLDTIPWHWMWGVYIYIYYRLITLFCIESRTWTLPQLPAVSCSITRYMFRQLHTHIHTHTYTYTYIYNYVWLHTHIYMYIFIYAHTHTRR